MLLCDLTFWQAELHLSSIISSLMVIIKCLCWCATVKATVTTCLSSCPHSSQNNLKAGEVRRKSNNLPKLFVVRSVPACHRHDNRDPWPHVGNWTPGSECRADTASSPSGNKQKLFSLEQTESLGDRDTKLVIRTAACFSYLPPAQDGPATVVSGRTVPVAMETLALAGKGAAFSFTMYFLIKQFRILHFYSLIIPYDGWIKYFWSWTV